MDSKERICQFFIRGRCSRSNCDFKHPQALSGGNPQFRPPPKPSLAKRPCRFFEKSGICQFGDNCRFSHVGGVMSKRKAAPPVDSDEDVLVTVEDSDSDNDTLFSGFTDQPAVHEGSVFSDAEMKDENESDKRCNKRPLKSPRKTLTPRQNILSVEYDAAVNESCLEEGVGNDGYELEELEIKSTTSPESNYSNEVVSLTHSSTTSRKRTRVNRNKDLEDSGVPNKKSCSNNDNNNDSHVTDDQVSRLSVKNKKGRPRKNNISYLVNTVPGKRKIGRPRKYVKKKDPDESISKKADGVHRGTPAVIPKTIKNNKEGAKSRSLTPRGVKLDLSQLDSEVFKPDFVPPIVKEGDVEYAIVLTGVQNTGLCGKYWGGSHDNLPSKRRRQSNVRFQLPTQQKRNSLPKKSRRSNMKKSESSSDETSPQRPSSSDGSIPRAVSEANTQTEQNIKDSESHEVCLKCESKLALDAHCKNCRVSLQSVLQPSSEAPIGNNSSLPLSLDRFVPYDTYRWSIVGKEEETDKSVHFSQALMIQNHLLSFLRIKGYAKNCMSNTKSNNVIFVVLEGEVTVDLHSSQKKFNAQKGDSFHVPPKFYYSLVNEKIREVELILFQFQANDS